MKEINLASEQNAKRILSKFSTVDKNIAELKQQIDTANNNIMTYQQNLRNQSAMIQTLIETTHQLKDELRSHINDKDL
jgi:uncharacterized protein YdcH (DUF465 family)